VSPSEPAAGRDTATIQEEVCAVYPAAAQRPGVETRPGRTELPQLKHGFRQTAFRIPMLAAVLFCVRAVSATFL